MSSNILCHPNLDHLKMDLPISLFIGKAMSGKTTLVMDTLRRMMTRPEGPVFKDVVLLSPTGTQELFSAWDTRHIYTEPAKWAEILNNIIAFQKKVPPAARGKVLIIIDDAIGVLSGKSGSDFVAVIKHLMSACRHESLVVWLLVQNLSDYHVASPSVRGAAFNTISFIILDESRERLERGLGRDKSTARQITELCWSEKARALCYTAEPDAETPERLSFVKLDITKSPKFGIQYH